MPPIDRGTMQGYIDAGMNAATMAEQGRALENLICYVFSQVPGVDITRRNALNAFNTEEIDVAFWNAAFSQDGFFFLPNIILVECKNWSGRVGSAEVAWFDAKLRSRGLNFGILVSPRGVTGSAADLTAAHATIAAALREGRRLVVVTTDELLALADTDALAHRIKEKLCDLAVCGTIV